MKKIILIILTAIGIIVLITMPENNEEILREIQNLKKQVTDLDLVVKSEQNKISQFKFPLDVQDKKIIEDIVNDRVFNSVWDKYFYFSTLFESADGYDLTGGGASGSNVSPDGLVLNTGAVLNNSVSFNKTPNPTGPGETFNILSFQKDQHFRANFAVDSTTNVTGYITRGVNYGANYPYYGFKILNNTLKGVSRDNNTDGESTVDLMTISVNTTYVGEAKYYPQAKIVFYIRNATTGHLEEKGTLTTKLPKATNTNNKAFYEYFVSTQDANNKMLTSSFLEYIQKR